ncbi:tetraacyldisaccharide 4'-kinase [Caenimonas koreensis]|uniref:tetraacyldisaccharide 4'-kinase n=1 Tax=Caenimonas koreensis TaxID=367474 RepID=UPI003783E64D
MAAALQRAWLRRGALAIALLPLSWLFGAITALRRLAFRNGWRSSSRVAVPVIVVGNVIAGGSGKTPVVMAIVEHLKARGIDCGVVSRGYGRRTSDCRQVLPTSKAADVGDEPLLVAQACAVPVYVAPRRADAAHALLAAYPSTRAIVCDDGLQHYALARDIEVCVFDDRGIGNGWLLPAGPLRESWPRTCDLVLRTSAAPGMDGHIVHRALAGFAIDSNGVRTPLAQLQGKPVIAVAAIARPDAFFSMLRQHGLTLANTIALPDHAAFDNMHAWLAADATLLCTQKDAVKLWPQRPDALAVPLDVTIDESFWQSLDRMLDAKLSSAHGPQTA